MANPSISMPDETLEKIDELRSEMKRRGEIDMDMGRSPMVTEILNQWIDEQEKRLDLKEDWWADEGNVKMAISAD